MRIETLEQLRTARIKSGLTHDEMANAMGMSKSEYIALETETTKFSKIHSLAAQRAFQIMCGENSKLVNPKHMSASDMIQQCDVRDIVELVDKLVGNFLDRDKLKARVLEIRERERSDPQMNFEKKGFTDANGQPWT